jgi:hypothetical protein
MPRFVILTHDFPFLHWDFMLEQEETLRTWRLEAPPDSQRAIDALPLPDHRRQYLDYEGPVSGNRGTVCRWDAGDYQTVLETPGRIEVELRGTRLRGRAILIGEPAGSSWHFHLEANGA